jgi:VWFA-related protein
MAGALACTFAAQLSALGQTPSQNPNPNPASSQPSSPSAIPDAPRPQTTLGPVTPGLGATSTSVTPPASDDADPDAVPSALPATKQVEAPDIDVAPDLPGTGQGSQSLGKLVLTSNFVDVPFTVKDSKGNLVPGLTWRDVRIYENGVRQSPKVFTADSFPLSVALVIDQSLDHNTMQAVNNSLEAIPAAFSKYDEVAVFTYNNGPKLQDGFTSGQSARLSAVLERTKSSGRDQIYYNAGEALSRGIDLNNGAQDNINPLTAQGPGSPQGLSQQQVPREVHTLNDAIFMAAKSLVKVDPERRRVIYVISDGKEYGSQIKQKELIRYLNTNKIAVYATLVGDSALAGAGFIDKYHLPFQMRDNVLPVYTAATGGQYYAEYRTRGIETSFAKLAEQVRTQYTIGYYSREPFIDGKYRQLEVRVLRPNLQVIAKKGYYPTAQAVQPRPVAANTPAASPSTNQ